MRADSCRASCCAQAITSMRTCSNRAIVTYCLLSVILSVVCYLICCLQGFLYGRLCPGDNEYAHPLDMVPIVDLNEVRVVPRGEEAGQKLMMMDITVCVTPLMVPM
jgi:hypothetical protein